ncbi:MAG: hypothetical protein ACQETL_19360, partial [Bacteroidota bacterium]
RHRFWRKFRAFCQKDIKSLDWKNFQGFILSSFSDMLLPALLARLPEDYYLIALEILRLPQLLLQH